VNVEETANEKKESDTKMAPTRYCPQCNEPMYADVETYLPAGTEVVYVCRTPKCGGFSEKVFVDD
jgi:hypothetical protein